MPDNVVPKHDMFQSKHQSESDGLQPEINIDMANSVGEVASNQSQISHARDNSPNFNNRVW